MRLLKSTHFLSFVVFANTVLLGCFSSHLLFYPNMTRINLDAEINEERVGEFEMGMMFPQKSKKYISHNCTINKPPHHLDILGLKEKYGYSPFYQLEPAFACAAETKRPILIVFTGHVISGSFGVEWEKLRDPLIQYIIENNFIVVALFLDDKASVPGKERLTFGEVNCEHQVTIAKTTASPYYSILNWDGTSQGRGMGYFPVKSRDDYVKFLVDGIHHNVRPD